MWNDGIKLSGMQKSFFKQNMEKREKTDLKNGTNDMSLKL